MVNRSLKVAIVASGLSQKVVAQRAGIDIWRLSRIVHGDVTTRPVERRRLARILQTPVEQLFEVHEVSQ